ncbi:TOBE domain-containing protein [Mesorhizobium sp. M1338]|uniref:TOBE domain-containing protein n=1 Tax=Mesorhizobium sp. M1338 TaxID=2957085 RepID=UPI003337D1D4
MPAGKRQVDFDRPVILGIRPEELKAVARDEASVTGIIDVVEPTGPETMVTVQVGEQSIIARLPPRFAGRREEPIFLAVDPASVNLFDPGSERRIDI